MHLESLESFYSLTRVDLHRRFGERPVPPLSPCLRFLCVCRCCYSPRFLFLPSTHVPPSTVDSRFVLHLHLVLRVLHTSLHLFWKYIFSFAVLITHSPTVINNQRVASSDSATPCSRRLATLAFVHITCTPYEARGTFAFNFHSGFIGVNSHGCTYARSGDVLHSFIRCVLCFLGFLACCPVNDLPVLFATLIGR